MKRGKELKLSNGGKKVLDFAPVPNILDIQTAFVEVFPNEKLLKVNVTVEKERAIITLESQVTDSQEPKNRTYAQYPGQHWKDIFASTPQLD